MKEFPQPDGIMSTILYSHYSEICFTDPVTLFVLI